MALSKISLVFYYGIFRYFPVSSNNGIGKFSNYLRYLCVKKIFKKCGKNITIQRGAYFGNGKQIEIDDFSGIGINCQVPSTIKIGKYVMMGQNVIIYDINHKHEDYATPMVLQGFSAKTKLVIQDDVWIGSRVLIMPSVKLIQHGSIIGAGTVLTKDVLEYSIVGGNPGKIIKFRNEQV